jgi:hypothetical protein
MLTINPNQKATAMLPTYSSILPIAIGSWILRLERRGYRFESGLLYKMGGHVPRLAKNTCNVFVKGSPDSYRDLLSTILLSGVTV